MVEILKILWDSGKIKVEFNSYFAILAIIIILIIIIRRQNDMKTNKLNPIEMEIDLGSYKEKFEIIRNSENLYIANRIYIELITRKAALEVDPEQDVIDEVYESWYKLFTVIRDEIKSIPGEYLENQYDTSNQLIELTVKILNEGLRPHLTKYQAEFKKWFKNQQEKRKEEAPQKIQKEYPRFNELIADIKNVNKILFSYSEELKKFIYYSSK
ncbi:hypothetical protein [Thermoanaerobacterium thermosaccharolyticum]|uniref:hypothetical protein n=1 Tax=Thermoanaerobacterium thermosaccharolyticum TaxID=1517 RepID=UPI00178344F2|nr:hypothetical protein [Thermoanaerobacterium thermosaccharolyticum]MBE0228113.1 hypothetical protein [Thermoanaerobacterium thermosaccharolyticum]